jgi:hypothetical protein
MKYIGFRKCESLLGYFFLQHEAGRVILEGCLSDDYYRVRELLYEQYAIV